MGAIWVFGQFSTLDIKCNPSSPHFSYCPSTPPPPLYYSLSLLFYLLPYISYSSSWEEKPLHTWNSSTSHCRSLIFLNLFIASLTPIWNRTCYLTSITFDSLLNGKSHISCSLVLFPPDLLSPPLPLHQLRKGCPCWRLTLLWILLYQIGNFVYFHQIIFAFLPQIICKNNWFWEFWIWFDFFVKNCFNFGVGWSWFARDHGPVGDPGPGETGVGKGFSPKPRMGMGMGEVWAWGTGTGRVPPCLTFPVAIPKYDQIIWV